MKNFKVKLLLMGAMTQIPDSQKLFGALVYMFAEKYGSKSATDFTRAILEANFHFALSNLMPEGYLPVPQGYILDRIAEKSNKEESLKKIRASIKLRNYIRSEDIGCILDNPENCKDIFPYITQHDFQQLRASIDSLRFDIPELDTRLYSVPTAILSEVRKDEVGQTYDEQVDTFCFYLQMDDGRMGDELLDMLNTAVNEEYVMVLGKRASQGMNLFQLRSIKEESLSRSGGNLFLNTGMLLPDCIDFKSSSLKLFTSERRPFEMNGGWNDDIPKQFISFIAPGSIIAVSDGLKRSGKSIESPFRRNRDIVFGNAFLYPLFPEERKVE